MTATTAPPRRAPGRVRIIALLATVLILTQAAGAAAVASKTLHTFMGTPDDGGQPSSTLVAGAGGFLYGTTSGGGQFGVGTVYRTNAKGVVTVLHSFDSADRSDTAEGSAPVGRLLLASDGRLYGTTSSGGDWRQLSRLRPVRLALQSRA